MSFLTTLPIERYDPDAFAAFVSDEVFTAGNSKAMAWMSQLAYEVSEPDKVRSILVRWGLSLEEGGVIVGEATTALPQASTHLFVASGRGATMIAFAGTDPLVLANWISDFDIHLSSTGTANGFKVATEIVWPRLNAVLSAVRPESRKIFVIGHSLGGAIAALAAEKIFDTGQLGVTAVYTFGMPRVGNQVWHQTFTGKLGERSFRMVYGEDIVPTVAPSSMGFRHVGRFLRCERGEKFNASDLAPNSESDDPQFAPGVAREIADFLRTSASGNFPLVQRAKVPFSLMLGLAPSTMRTDPGGIAIESLPPRLRDHMPDRYIGAM